MAKGRDVIQVYLDAPELGEPVRVGMLYRDMKQTALPPAFEYDRVWLAANPFMLDPRLALYTGPQYPAGDTRLFGVFLDSSPDRWGRILMNRREAMNAAQADRPVRILFEMDYLLGVNDVTRQGALRFKREEGPFLDDDPLPTPSVAQLAALEEIVLRIEEAGVEALPEYQQWLGLLVAPGSSLGGARPKANFREADGSLWIAKFPAKGDLYDVGAWEYVVHVLAQKAGIRLPPSRQQRIGNQSGYRTFCVKRFDRLKNGSRRMYASAMTLLERTDGDDASYLEIVDLIERYGAAGQVKSDLHELFRRVIFNVMVSNRDDHLRNHGFILTPSGWTLSDAFDINPNIQSPKHALALDEANPSPDLGVAFGTHRQYRLTEEKAIQIVEAVSTAVSEWEAVAKQAGLSKPEIDRMRGAFLQY